MITDYFLQDEKINIGAIPVDDIAGNQEFNKEQANETFRNSMSLQYFSLTCQNMTKLVKLTNPEKP